MFSDKSSVQMIASIRAMRIDNLIVDNLIVPIGWMLENGVRVTVTKDPAAFRPDGSIAIAGEYFQNRIHFTSENGLDEDRIFNLVGSMRGPWSQSSVDNEVYYMLNKNEHLKAEHNRLQEKHDEAQRLHNERMRQRDHLIELFFLQHGKPANAYRVGQLVATRDGLIWKISSKIHDDIELSAQDHDSTKVRVVSNEAILIPANDKIVRDFKSSLRGITY